MKPVLSHVVFLILVIYAVAGAEPFEGVMVMTITVNDTKNSATVSVKNGKIRFDPQRAVSGKHAYGIINAGRKTVTIINRDERTYSTFPLPKEPSANDLPRAVFKRGEATKILAGIKCEEWIFSDNGRTVRFWVQNRWEFPFTPLTLERLKGDDRKFFSRSAMEVIGKGYFPLKISARGDSGTLEMEVTSIENRRVDESAFSIPPGFRKRSEVLREKRKLRR